MSQQLIKRASFLLQNASVWIIRTAQNYGGCHDSEKIRIFFQKGLFESCFFLHVAVFNNATMSKLFALYHSPWDQVCAPGNSSYYIKFSIATGYMAGTKDYLTKVAAVQIAERLIWSMKV